MSVDYNRYLAQHIVNVTKGLDWFRANLPDVLKENQYLAVNYDTQFAHHDASKYDKEEYDAYDAYFYGYNKSFKVVQNFKRAWLRHIHQNPHHWQHWVLVNDDPEEAMTCIEMPYPYVIEMICDWWSFSWASGNLTEIFSWWEEHKDYIQFHKNTRRAVLDILGQMRAKLNIEPGEPPDTLAHHGIKGQKWGVRRTPEELRAAKGLASKEKSDIIDDKDFVIPKSLGAKARNYEVYDPSSGECFYFVEGSRIKNPTVFAGKGGVKPLQPEVAKGLSEQLGGKPSEWQHCKGFGTLDFYGKDREAEVHWFQEASIGKHRFRVKKWLD